MAINNAEDRAFIKVFAGVLGVLVGTAVLFFIAANLLAIFSQDSKPNQFELAQIQHRLQPVAAVNTSAKAAQQASQKKAQGGGGSGTGPAHPWPGHVVYEKVCSSCHAAGVLGAPKYGDKAAWAPRAKEGLATLVDHAVNGYKAMPPKGGDASLTKQEVQNDVEYMLKAVNLLGEAKKASKS